MASLLNFFSSCFELLSNFPSYLLTITSGLLVIGILVFYFWVWLRWPKSQVPIHLSPHELRVLVIQDQLRKTQIQVPIVIALVATFILVLVQFNINARQWTTDYQLRNTQLQMNQFADAVKSMSGRSVESRVAGIYALQNLVGLDVDRNIRRVNEMLTATVRSRTTEERLRRSIECNGAASGLQDREEALEDVQAALTVIGNKQYAAKFALDYDPDQRVCIPKRESAEKSIHLSFRPRLEHRFLDNLNLAETDFSCSNFSASRIRRTSFEYANLQGADFRATIFENRDLLGLKEAVAESRRDAADVASWIHTEPENGWRRYRCWSTFFKNAFLDGADFTNAQLSGAVFENASMKGTKFDYANITLADFRGTKVTAEQLKHACVWDNGQPLFDKDNKIKIDPCVWDGK